MPKTAAKTAPTLYDFPVTAARLRELVSYDPETGLFRWRQRVARRVQVGDLTSMSVNSEGYRQLRIDGHVIKAHRAAWLYVHGKLPDGFIDHLNCDRSDNRIANLRPASRSDNLGNSKVYRGQKAMPKGVRFNKEAARWTARIQRHGQKFFLGYFDTAEAATSAYAEAAALHFGQFARSA